MNLWQRCQSVNQSLTPCRVVFVPCVCAHVFSCLALCLAVWLTRGLSGCCESRIHSRSSYALRPRPRANTTSFRGKSAVLNYCHWRFLMASLALDRNNQAAQLPITNCLSAAAAAPAPAAAAAAAPAHTAAPPAPAAAPARPRGYAAAQGPPAAAAVAAATAADIETLEARLAVEMISVGGNLQEQQGQQQ